MKTEERRELQINFWRSLALSTVTIASFIGTLIGLFGLPNIFENLSKGTSAESADVSGEKKIKIGILSMVRTNLGTSAAPLCWARPSAARSSRCSGWPSPLTFD